MEARLINLAIDQMQGQEGNLFLGQSKLILGIDLNNSLGRRLILIRIKIMELILERVVIAPFVRLPVQGILQMFSNGKNEGVHQGFLQTGLSDDGNVLS